MADLIKNNKEVKIEKSHFVLGKYAEYLFGTEHPDLEGNGIALSSFDSHFIWSLDIETCKKLRNWLTEVIEDQLAK